MSLTYLTKRSFGSYYTVPQLFKRWNTILQKENISESDISAKHIFSHVLNLPFHKISENSSSNILNTNEVESINKLFLRRLKREPVQYLIGNWDFLDFTYEIESPVLIPRPETEELVDLILQRYQQSKQPTIRFLEIGCGSGVISVALLKHIPGAICDSIDISEKAVELTKRNMASVIGSDYEGRAKVIKCDFNKFVHKGQPYDFIVSNPPYIAEEDYDYLEDEVKLYEDKQALVGGGSDGSQFIDLILKKSTSFLKVGGKIFIECDLRQPEKYEKEFAESNAAQNEGIVFKSKYKDFTNRNRFCEFTYKRKPQNTEVASESGQAFYFA